MEAARVHVGISFRPIFRSSVRFFARNSSLWLRRSPNSSPISTDSTQYRSSNCSGSFSPSASSLNYCSKTRFFFLALILCSVFYLIRLLSYFFFLFLSFSFFSSLNFNAVFLLSLFTEWANSQVFNEWNDNLH